VACAAHVFAAHVHAGPALVWTALTAGCTATPDEPTLTTRLASLMSVWEGSAMFTSVSGLSVVVTGGTRGIGKGIASVFARNGARVLVTGRDAATASEAAAALAGDVTSTQADVSRREDCQQMAATAEERLGGIDVLCANAGIFPGNRPEGLAALGWDHIRKMAAPIPLRRLGTVDEIGHAALFLATAEAAYITGQTIVIDGGQVLPESPEAVRLAHDAAAQEQATG
jgi:NAD(P)-dependent dehydrogenase (short-subunit alcohol dehydrogenase family)